MKRSVSAIGLLGIAVSLAAAEKADRETEIKRARKELTQLQTERQKNRLDMAKDVKKFKEYTKRTAERLATVMDETAAINQQITVQKRRNDSLAALINTSNQRVRQFEMSQDAMREKLALSCDRIISDLQNIAPMVRQKKIASLALLKSELRNKSVDNVEALNRMIQILISAEEVNGSIQVSQESSPISEVRGTVYRLRVGAFFEAVVNVKGDECAVWHGADAKGWKTIKDPAVAAELLKAANIREGKVIPEFVTLPLVVEGGKGGAQ